MDHATRAGLIVPGDLDISVSRQSELVGISRSSYYYRPVVDEEEIRIMSLIDEIFTECPFYGSRKIRTALRREHLVRIAREHVQRLMRVMGLEAIYPKSHSWLSDPGQMSIKYPYLLKNLTIRQPNQVWGTDITYVRLGKRFAYLVAILDWYSRFVLSWVLSENMEIDFCIENLETALKLCQPEIHNSDQGSHFTSPRYTNLLVAKNIRISMDGRGRCMDNIFTERLWRSVKYENIYIHSYQDWKEAKTGLAEYFKFYNYRRPHQSLNDRTPAEVYFGK